MYVCALTLSLQSCLSNICYLVCGFDKSAHHTHTHSLFLSLGHVVHTHTAYPNSPWGLCRPVYTQLCPDKGERERGLTEGQTGRYIPLDRIIYNVELFSYMTIKKFHAFHIWYKIKVTVWRIDLRLNSRSSYEHPIWILKRWINKIKVGNGTDKKKTEAWMIIQSVTCILQTVCLFLKEMWQICDYSLSKNSLTKKRSLPITRWNELF